jgi:hypothetical protein
MLQVYHPFLHISFNIILLQHITASKMLQMYIKIDKYVYITHLHGKTSKNRELNFLIQYFTYY